MLEGRTRLLDFKRPPWRTQAFEDLTMGVAGGGPLPKVRVWVNRSRTVGWVPTWERVLILAANGMRRTPGHEGVCYGWEQREGFGVGMPPTVVVGRGLAVWPLSDGEEGYLCVCPRVVPREGSDSS